jgi:hypothetical protein
LVNYINEREEKKEEDAKKEADMLAKMKKYKLKSDEYQAMLAKKQAEKQKKERDHE